MIIGPVCN